MKKISIILSLLIASILPHTAAAQSTAPGQWRLHNSFDCYIYKVIDTSSRVYILAQGQGYWDWAPGFTTIDSSLFVYDKNESTMEAYNSTNYIHGNSLKSMYYNRDKGYMLLIYSDYNIDILYDDDRCYNVPGLASAILTTGKDVNSVTFDSANNRAYVATAFGYLVIDDSKNVICESHVYNQSINSVARAGNRLIAATDDGLYVSSVKRTDNHASWSSFTKVTDGPSAAKFVEPLNDDKFMYVATYPYVGSFDDAGNFTQEKQLYTSNVQDISESRDGYFLNTEWDCIIVKLDGTGKTITGTSNIRFNLVNCTQSYGSWAGEDIWQMVSRTGLYHKKYENGSWATQTLPTFGEYATLNAPNVYRAFGFAPSSKYGMVASNSIYNDQFTSTSVDYRSLISTYMNNEWVNKSPVFSTSSLSNLLRATTEGTLDPENEDLLWMGSFGHGMISYNLSDLSIKIYTRSGDNTSKSGVSAVFPVSSGWSAYCRVGVPKFDADGTLWAIHSSEWNGVSAPDLYCWTKEDRAANNVSNIKSINVEGFESNSHNRMLPLVASQNKNLIVLASSSYDPGFFLLNHKGTLDSSADDQVVHYTSLVDQDGNGVNAIYYYTFCEDPSTGKVWVGTSNGLFYFTPSEGLSGDTHVNRVKIARNDGTGLADYLLEGSPVYDIKIDGAGHKWFATLGNGVVETSADGSEILLQLTSDNSYLPSDNVYAIGFENDSNCVWLGTEYGIAQYYSDTAPAGDDYDSLVAYPNPVRPEYYGYLTIQGLMDGSLVKVLDASGGLVKELGRSEGGMMLWDLTNSTGVRVPTGVYYIAASTSSTDSSDAKVTKVLVMN